MFQKAKTLFRFRQRAFFAGHLKNAFFDYIPQCLELQVKTR